MPRLDLLTRTELFALAVFEFCRRLPKTKEAQEPADQLRRAANGIRMNYRAARRGRSHAEFKAKLGVCSKKLTKRQTGSDTSATPVCATIQRWSRRGKNW